MAPEATYNFYASPKNPDYEDIVIDWGKCLLAVRGWRITTNTPADWTINEEGLITIC